MTMSKTMNLSKRYSSLVFPGCGLLLCLLFLCSGCAQHENGVSRESIVADATVQHIEEDVDHGCSYFYFLWGRHSELSGKNEAALEAYQKAMICDPGAEFVVRKIPLLLLRLNRGDEAIVKLEEYLEHHPDDTGSRMLLAKIFIRQGKFSEAASQYRKVHALTPDDSIPLLLLSELYLAEGKQELAQDALQSVLEIDSESYSAHLLLARLLIAERQFDKGQEHYQQALLSNWSPELQLEMAEGFLQQKSYDRAIKLYQDLLERDELNEDARIALIHVYLLQQKENKALTELNKLKAISKHPAQVDLTIVRIYARWKEYDKAVAILEELLKENEVTEARYLLALLHYQVKQYEAVLNDLQGMNRNAEEYADGIFLQVRSLRQLGRNEQAGQLLESAVAEEEGRSPDMYVLLASIYQLLDKEPLGRETFLRSLAAYPDDEELVYEYGQYLDYTGDYQQAMDVMQQVITLQPEHAGALNYIGYTWADKKINLDKAFVYISRAVDLKPENGYIRDSLGWVYFQQGKLEEARKTLEHAVQLSADDPAILDHLADVYLAQGRTAEALATYRKALELYTVDSKDKDDGEVEEDDDDEESEESKKEREERDEKNRSRIEKKILLLEEQESR